jgi:hypothetical protein
MVEQISKGRSNNSDRGDQLQNLFFSKDSISGLNKFLLQQNNLNNLNRDGKQEIINILVKNMKNVYRSLDLGKINNTNFDSIFKQFKEHSLKLTISEIKQSNLFTDYSQSASDLKFQRDFTSNPNSGNKYMDRPEASKHFNPISLNQKVASIEQKRNKVNSFSSFDSDINMGNYESSLDQAFKPIVDNIESNNMFNSYSSGRTGDVNNKMDEIQQLRQTELTQRNQRPSTPDFLKPIKSNPDKNSEKHNQNQSSMPLSRGGKPDFKNMDSTNFNQGFQGLSNDVGGDLYSLDNIDKPLVETEIIEDKTSFEDRLKRLQSERDGLKVTTQQKNINFTDENFPKSDIASNYIPKHDSLSTMMNEPKEKVKTFSSARLSEKSKDFLDNEPASFESKDSKTSMLLNNLSKTQFVYEPYQAKLDKLNLSSTMINEPKEKVKTFSSARLSEKSKDFLDNEPASFESKDSKLQLEMQRAELIKQAEEAKRNQLIKQAEEAKRNQLIKQAEEAKRNELLKTKNQNIALDRTKSFESENKTSYIYDNSSPDKFSSLKNLMKTMNIEIKEDSPQLNQLKYLIDKLSQENSKLKEIIENNKNSELEKIMDIKKQIAEEFEILKVKNNSIRLKELELSKKELDIKELIDNYDYLFKTRQIQIEVYDPNHQSKYTWSMDMIPNVTGIKLMSYSLPEPKFNIEENKNNLLHINVNNDDIQIVLPNGKYNIDDLICSINEEISKQKPNIKLFLNKQQKVIISSEEESDIINIIPTQLSQYNLGFINEIKLGHSHIASKIWDLRMDDKVYLYLNNLSEEVPFGLLYFNGKSVSQFKFQKPFNLDNLEIMFKDSIGNQYNFYDLPHNLSFIIEKLD